MDKNYHLYIALSEQKSSAIRAVFDKISGTVAQLSKPLKISEEDLEEVLWSSITILLLKIKEGSYSFQGYDPSSFAIEIAKNKLKQYHHINLNRIQKTEPLNQEYEYHISEIESDNRIDQLEKWIERLDPQCRLLIRLKYFEELSDKLVIEKKLSPYQSVDSLKNKRSKCLKSLSDIRALERNK
ncbi:MAG TPA: hypothetical protein PLD02_05120 [Saprospiraceae bacterium]|nr:hypothetical protein [Saprospiraceae bacterium]